MLGSTSGLGLMGRDWEGCSSVCSAMPRDTFSPVAARCFQPHTAASGFLLVSLSVNTKSGDILFGQHICVYGRAQLAWLHQQNLQGAQYFRQLRICPVEEISEPGGGLSAEWLSALGAVGAARSKLCGHQ